MGGLPRPYQHYVMIDKGLEPAITFGCIVCLSITMVTGDLYCLSNRVYCKVEMWRLTLYMLASA